jgi:two-component system chemotaxis sensor kinase CheA
MALVGELVLTRNQVMQYTDKQEDSSFTVTCQRLNLIASELQEGVMKTRMQPIGSVWNKFPRVVRDLAMQCGKQVDLRMKGKETEWDKSLIEAIKDPLTHIVRNSVDHGIETPEERVKNGKPEQGRLSLRAFHEGGKVNIVISDDGSGINSDRIAAKAIKVGLITQDQVAKMNVREQLNLVFLPGLSTQEEVTNLSGRGVGMDVVKTNIEKIGGTIDIQTEKGEGTTLKITIPLTLAIIPALMITCGEDRFAIPQVNLPELVRLDDFNEIETIHGAPVYRLRGKLLPIVFLDTQLELNNRTHGENASDSENETKAVNIVVLQADDRQFGLVVDSIVATEEIVVKPLNKSLKELNSYAGATILGDGKVALILDVFGLAHNADILQEGGDP